MALPCEAEFADRGELCGLFRFKEDNLGNGLANCMFGVCRVLLIVLCRCCCECCWAAAAAIEVLMGGGFGLFLWTRDGPAVLLFVLVAVDGDEVEEAEDDDEDVEEDDDDDVGAVLEEAVEVGAVVVVDDDEDDDVVVVVAVDKLSVVGCPVLIRSEMIVLLLTSQLLGEVGGEVEVGEAEAELELATELQLPVFLDKSVGSFSLAEAEA